MPSRPWLTAGFFAVALLACLGLFREKAFRDPGALWHVRVGEVILADGFPRTDPFTYTHAGTPWVPQQWLAEVLMAMTHRLAGLDGLLVLLCAGVAALHAWVFARLLGTGLSPLMAGLLAAALLFVGSFHYYARPHMATVAGIGLTVAWLVDVDRGRSARVLWWLVPSYVLWTNLHGGVLGGLLTLGLAAGGWLVTGRREWRTAAAVTLACGLTPLVNPFGLDLPRTWFGIVGSKVLKEAVSEHSPLSLAVPADRLVVLVAVGYLACVVWNWRAARVTWLLPAVWFLLALTSIRHGPLFVIAAAFVLPDVLATGGHKPAEGEPPGSAAAPPWSDAPSAGLRPPVACVAFTLALFVGARNWARLDPEVHPTAFTPAISEWAVTTGPDVQIYNDANFGGHLLWHFPGRRIFMDDRFEQYGEDWTTAYVDAIWHHPERFDEWDRRWHFGLALVATDRVPTPLDRFLAGKPDWVEVARQPNAVLYRRK